MSVATSARVNALEAQGPGDQFRPASDQHLPALDGIRGLAIALVMVYHFAAGAGAPPAMVDGWFRKVATMGWVGVDIFFVLSGFLITGILLDSKGSKHYFRNFWGRRTLRIFPLYYAFLLGWLIILPRLFPGQLPPAPEGSQIWPWTYTTNMAIGVMRAFRSVPAGTAHFWSLAVEEQFYLVWPFAVYFMARRRMMVFCIVSICLAVAARAVMVSVSVNDVAPYVLMPMRMDALAVGGLVALLMRDERGREWIAARIRPLFLVSLAIIALLIALSWNDQNVLSPYSKSVQVFGFLPLAVIGAGLIVLSVDPKRASGRLQRWMGTDSMRVLGRYSYGLYVFHVPIAKTFKTLLVPDDALPATLGTELPAQLGLVAMLTVVSLGVAAASYHGFEVHFLKLKRFFRSRDREVPARSEAA